MPPHMTYGTSPMQPQIGSKRSRQLYHNLPASDRPSKMPKQDEAGESSMSRGTPNVVDLTPLLAPLKPTKLPRFTPEEDSLLVQLRETTSFKWKNILDFFPGRSSATLRTRYCMHLKVRDPQCSKMADNSNDPESISFISGLYPNAKEYMITRMAQQCEELRKLRAQHETSTADGPCDSGHLCLASSPRPSIVVNPTDKCVPSGHNSPVKFECPICFRIVNISSNKEWNMHVKLDVRSYTCTYANCTNLKPWSRLSDWSNHEKIHDPSEVWVCQKSNKRYNRTMQSLLCLRVYTSTESFQEHLQEAHQFNPQEAKKIVGECHFTKTNTTENQPPNLWVCKVEQISGDMPDMCQKGFTRLEKLISHLQRRHEVKTVEAEDYHYIRNNSGETCKLCSEWIEEECYIPHMVDHFKMNLHYYLQYAEQAEEGQQSHRQRRNQKRKRRQEDNSASHSSNAEPQKSNAVIIPILSLRRCESRPKRSPQKTRLTKCQPYICDNGKRFKTAGCLRTHNETTHDAGQMSLIVALPQSSALHSTQLLVDDDNNTKSTDRMKMRNTLQKLSEWYSSLPNPPVELTNVEGKAAMMQFCEILKDCKRKGLDEMHSDLNLRKKTMSNYAIPIVKIAIRSASNTRETQKLLVWYSRLPKPPTKVFGASKMAVLAQICGILQCCQMKGLSAISRMQLSSKCATKFISIGIQCAKLLQDDNEEAQMEGDIDLDDVDLADDTDMEDVELVPNNIRTRLPGKRLDHKKGSFNYEPPDSENDSEKIHPVFHGSVQKQRLLKYR